MHGYLYDNNCLDNSTIPRIVNQFKSYKLCKISD